MPFCAPQIVYSGSWLGKTAAIASTDIFTPGTEGLFRLSASILTSSPGGSSSVALQPMGEGISNSSGAYPITSDFVFIGVSGAAISFSTSLSGMGTTYDLFITLEQLG